MDEQTVAQAIEQALDQAKQQKIQGKESTPFLLEKMAKFTDGDSLFSNIKLVLNNARLAAEIAKSVS